MKVLSVLFFGLSLLAIVKLPIMSPSSGGSAEIIFAIAHQDMPSGICDDRDFDWPTGEALRVDVPA